MNKQDLEVSQDLVGVVSESRHRASHEVVAAEVERAGHGLIGLFAIDDPFARG